MSMCGVQDMLVAGLLHDTVEDTDRVTLDGIKREFGQTCARIVEGETKFSKLGQIHPDMTKDELQVLSVPLTQPLRDVGFNGRVLSI
jgi:GTP diphosphokinase / guanosine-3',5'-bis(diphosphate) 3'-diphosphatase